MAALHGTYGSIRTVGNMVCHVSPKFNFIHDREALIFSVGGIKLFLVRTLDSEIFFVKIFNLGHFRTIHSSPPA